jgi:threonine dehydrogenase-like Zn-dependent dehydrogenase
VRATAYNSRVVACGFYQGDGIGLRLGEEFHHNRIAVVSSQISSVRPDLAHRWSHERLAATVMDLIARGEMTVDPLVSHVVPVARAADAFALLHDGNPDVMQVVLDFTAGEEQ